MKLYIAFTGLMMIIHPPDPGTVDILFLNAKDRTVAFEGAEVSVEEHPLRLIFDRFSSSQQLFFPAAPVEIVVDARPFGGDGFGGNGIGTRHWNPMYWERAALDRCVSACPSSRCARAAARSRRGECRG